MQIIESSDGTIRLIELDPAKHHVLIVDEGATDPESVKLIDGAIIVKRPGASVEIIEANA
jgi:hypothetical protein